MLVSREAVLSVLQECAQTKDLAAGRHAHCLVACGKLESIGILRDHLIRVFTSCGSLLEANLVFCRASKLTVRTWHAIISTHVSLGESSGAISLYGKMQQEGFEADEFIYSSVSKACGDVGALLQGRLIHSDVVKDGLEKHKVVQTSLLDMYAKCGSVKEACILFDQFLSRDVVVWGAMIAGYTEHGSSISAFDLFNKMLQEGIQPDKSTFLCILKACANMESLGQGMRLHYYIIITGLELDIVIGNTLVDMYAKCGTLDDASRVFYCLPKRDKVSWGALISGCCQHHENCMMTLQFFMEMQQEGMGPENVAFVGALKACSTLETIIQGSVIHAMAIENGMDLELSVGNSLVDMYAKCGYLQEALGVFAQLKCHNVVSWNVIIAGFVQHGDASHAIGHFVRMLEQGFTPDEVTYSFTLKACVCVGAMVQGRLIHDRIIRGGFTVGVTLGNALIDLYGTCGMLDEANKVFSCLHVQSASTWSMLIAAYVQHECEYAAFELFERMEQKGVKADIVVFLSVLKACTTHATLVHGRWFHGLILNSGLELDSKIGLALVDMYARCGSTNEAYKTFKSLPDREVALWSSMVAGYGQHGDNDLALDIFLEMQQEGQKPDKITFLSVLKSFANTGAILNGMIIHDWIARRGLLSDLVVSNALVDLYAKCGCLEEAWKVFEGLLNQDAVTWGAIISGYVQHGQGLRALQLFERMCSVGVNPDEITFSCILKACTSIGAVSNGRVIHDQIIRGSFTSNLVVKNSLIDMYAKFGLLYEAQLEFNTLSKRNVVSCNALISGFVQHDQDFSALDVFNNMQEQGLKPDSVTFTCSLKACGHIGAVRYGRFIHDQIIKSSFFSDTAIGNTLVDMYASCGSLDEANKVFKALSGRDIVSWNAMIAGYAQLGDHNLVSQCLQRMQQEGLKPDSWTYTSILASCCYSGLVEEGQKYFKNMRDLFGVIPSIEHFNCMVVLLASAGRLDEGQKLLQSMPLLPDLTGWKTLLTACRTHGKVDLGTTCFNESVYSDPYHAAGYVLLSNIYADACMWKDINRLQELRKGASAWKKPGMAWIELNTKMHEFIVSDKAHSQNEKMNCKLEGLRERMKSVDYIPQVDIILDLPISEDGMVLRGSFVKEMAETV